MKSLPALDLETALLQCGAACDMGVYGSVAVRAAPWWLECMWGSGVEAMTLPGVVLVSRLVLERIDAGEAGALLTHEAVHVDQWRASGVLPFLLHYIGDYVRGRAVGLPHHTAYRAIRFERAARQRAEKQ
ncbi:MAG: hypothetical protein ABFS21_02725 [Actinomycetota bacterium]